MVCVCRMVELGKHRIAAGSIWPWVTAIARDFSTREVEIGWAVIDGFCRTVYLTLAGQIAPRKSRTSPASQSLGGTLLSRLSSKIKQSSGKHRIFVKKLFDKKICSWCVSNGDELQESERQLGTQNWDSVSRCYLGLLVLSKCSKGKFISFRLSDLNFQRWVGNVAKRTPSDW